MTSYAFKKIFIFAILIRFVCLYLFRNVSNYDLQSYIQIGELTLKGINIYPEVANLHHPYLPFFLYIEAIAVWIGQIRLMGLISPILIIKFINVIFDLGTLHIVYLLSKKNLKTAFLYAINPVAILITTLHGQFDVIPIFFILLAIYLIKIKKELGAILSFSFAILIKTWPLLFFMIFAKNIKNKKLLIWVTILPLLFMFLYCWIFKASPADIGKIVINYQGLSGIWGIWDLLDLLGKKDIFFQKIMTMIFLITFLSYSWIQKEKDLIKNILKLLFFFYVFTTNFSIQYFAWIIPFLILIKPKNYFKLIIFISIYLLSFYYYWLLCSNCISTPNWLTISQDLIGFLLWLSFIKIGYLSSK